MSNKLKYLLYIVVVILALLFIYFKFFSNSISPNSAIAFEWEKSVDVYFPNTTMGSSEDCSKVFPVSRKILNAETFGPGAIETLLKGVSENEKNTGYFTSINDGVLIQKFDVKNKVAYVDFSDRLNEGVAGSCKVASIRSQIENTLNSLPDIDSVVISVNGKTEEILQP